MPLYQYTCKSGHTFEALVKMNLSDEPSRCPVRESDPAQPCNASVVRILSTPAKLFPGADSWRK
jgi:putative FmdB family regulatory protein